MNTVVPQKRKKSLEEWLQEPSKEGLREIPIVRHCGNCHFSTATGKINAENENQPALVCESNEGKACFGVKAGSDNCAQTCPGFIALDDPDKIRA